MKILEQHLCFGVAVAVKFSTFLVGSENGGAGSANQWEGLQGVGDTCWSREVVYSSGTGTQPPPPAVVHPEQYHPPTTERSFQKRRSHHSYSNTNATATKAMARPYCAWVQKQNNITGKICNEVA